MDSTQHCYGKQNLSDMTIQETESIVKIQRNVSKNHNDMNKKKTLTHTA